MKDIEKIKAEYEHKIREAELENKYEKRLGVQTRVFIDDIYKSRGVDTRVCFGSVVSLSKDNCITNEQAGKILSIYKPTRDICISERHKVYGHYYIKSHREFGDTFSRVCIGWACNNVYYEVVIAIEGNEELEGFMRKGMREISNSELSTYKPLNSKGMLDGSIKVVNYAFATGQTQIMYNNGSVLLTDNYLAKNIVDMLIDSYEKTL